MLKSIILAAGKGTRMKSDKPKILHEIFNKTLLGYVIDAVNNTELADENIVVVGHQAEKVEEYIESNYKNAKTVIQSPQLGTGHAVSMALPLLENFNGEIIVPPIYKDIYFERKPLLGVIGKNGLKGLITPEGKEIIPCEFESIRWLQDDKHILCCRQGFCQMLEYIEKGEGKTEN